MKLGSVVSIAVFNLVAIILAALVYGDRVWRISYWQAEGFTPATTYYLFFYVTSALKGSTHIGTLLTVDWLQVLLVVAVVVDGFFVLGLLRGRRHANSDTGNATVSPVAQPE